MGMLLRYDKRHFEISQTDYIFFFLVIIYLGSAMLLTRNSLEALGGTDLVSVTGKLFMVVFGIYVFYKHNYKFSSAMPWAVVFILAIWALLQFLKYQTLSVYPMVRFMNLFFAVIIIKVYGLKIVYLFENVVGKLALISLIGWGLTLLIPNVMLELASLSPFEPYGLVQNGSFFVFGISDSIEVLRRNLGFAWEPGRFGSILSVGLFFNLIANDFRIRRNKNFWYIVGAILSTQSTTAYVTLMLVIAFYLYNKRRSMFIKLMPLVAVLFVLIIQVDFVGDKIQSLWLTDEHSYDWQKQLDYFYTQDIVVVPQRFDGLFYELLNILHDPVIGNASDEEAYLYSLFGIRFSLSNGCLRIFANMGIFIGFLYYVYLYRSSKLLSVIFKYRGKIFWLVLFVMINISYSWVFEPVFLPLYYKRNKALYYDFNKKTTEVLSACR